MNESVIHIHPAGPLLALVGNPNCGKTALFNLLTGSRQKVANYAGVTVERKEGKLVTHAGKMLRVLDLPGAYSLYPRSPDERVTCDVLAGRARGEKRPDLVVCVVDATNLRRNLRLVLAVRRLGLPCVLVLNMTDVAERRGIRIDAERLSQVLGLPVVRSVGVTRNGDAALRVLLDDPVIWRRTEHAADATEVTAHADHQSVRAILQQLQLDEAVPQTLGDRIDAVVLHPVLGPLLLTVLLFLMFQAVFSWSEAPRNIIQAASDWLGSRAT